MAFKKPVAPAAAARPAQPGPRVSLPPPPAQPRQTFGDRMAAQMTADRNKADGQRAAKQAEQMSQSRQAAERMAPGTGGRGTQQEYAARMQRQAGSNIPAFAFNSSQGALQRAPAGVPQYGPQTQPPPAILGNRGMAGAISGPTPPPAGMGPMGPTGPGTQTGGPAPMGMAPPNAAKVGMFKKGGAVRYAGGGKADEKKEAPIPAETIASMKRQAAQEKADRKQAEEQKAGEKEVKENMGRLGFKKGGSIKASKMGAVKVAKPTMRSASSRADGIAIRGKTRA